MQPRVSTPQAPVNSLEALKTQPQTLQALPTCLALFCDSLAQDLPSLEGKALHAQVQDLLKPGQDLDRACPRFQAGLIQDALFGMTAASTNRALRQIAERMGEYFSERAAGIEAPLLSHVLPTLLKEAGEELGSSRGAMRDRKVLRALRLIWAATWRGPRCQAIAAKACRRVWSRKGAVAAAQRAMLLGLLQPSKR